MKTQLEICLDAGFLIEYPMVFVKSITRHKALQLYSTNTPILITDGNKYYKIEKATLVQDWEGILFIRAY